ncbi:MAG TPA: peptide chain release factor 1 [Spirochaetota bacterium]|nr:peptide chain release factor 1 [Spirochaetota bacterium]
MEKRLDQVKEKFRHIETQMSDPGVISDQQKFKQLSQEHSQLTPVVKKYDEYKNTKKELEDSTQLLDEEKDPEMKNMLLEEIDKLQKNLEELEDDLMVLLLPKDPHSGKDVMIEIRAGTGGDEAALFATNLYRMYSRYADIMGWKCEFIEGNLNEIGGYKEVIFSVRGDSAYDNLKFESGVHRVQRIPETESGGRIHTSAVTVAVMAEAEENEIEINPEDLRIDVYRSSGHGGQSVNTTDSAVRITHIPSGMVVTCQDEKSQLKNKTKALRVLRARLFEKSEQERMARESELRKSQIGSGDRSERIRTYNFPQSRVTDHRINLTLHSLEQVLNGELEPVVQALKKYETEQQLRDVER